MESNPLRKSFEYAKKNNGPKIDPCIDGLVGLKSIKSVDFIDLIN